MGLDYDSIVFNMNEKKTDVTEPVYSDTKDLRPDMGGNSSSEQPVDNQDDTSVKSERVRKAEVISDSITGKDLISKKDDESSDVKSERISKAESVIKDIANKSETPTEQIESVKKQRPRSKRPATTTDIKGFPIDVVNAVRKAFPGARSNRDALAAMAVVFLGENFKVSDSIEELVSEYNKGDPIVSIEDRLKHIEQTLYELNKNSSETELGLAYMIYDRLGYRTSKSNTPRNIDMLESGRAGAVTDVVFRMREQSREFKRQENIKEGRPIR